MGGWAGGGQVSGQFGYWLSCSLCFPAKCLGGRVGGAGERAIRLLAVLLSVFFSQMLGWVGVGRVSGQFGYWLSCSLCFPAKCLGGWVGGG